MTEEIINMKYFIYIYAYAHVHTHTHRICINEMLSERFYLTQ